MSRIRFVVLNITFLLVSACASSDNLKYGDSSSNLLKKASSSNTNCDVKILAYERVINKELGYSKEKDSSAVSQAILGLKAVVPSCERNQKKVTSYLNGIVDNLTLVKHKNTEEIVNVYIEHLKKNSDEDIRISPNLERIYIVNKDQARQLLNILLERGFWGDGDVVCPNCHPDLSNEYGINILSELKSKLSVAEEKAEIETGGCSFYKCENVELLSRYRRVYAQELRRMGLGGSKRVRIAENMAHVNDQIAQKQKAQSDGPSRTSSLVSDLVGAVAVVAIAAQGAAMNPPRSGEVSEIYKATLPSSTSGYASGSLSSPASQEQIVSVPKIAAISGNNSSAAVNTSQQSSSPSNIKRYPALSHCVTLTNPSQAYSLITNRCNVPVLVKWCDQGGCKTAWGGQGIKPGQSESITPLKGQAPYAACEYPHSPRAPSGGNWTGGAFFCVDQAWK